MRTETAKIGLSAMVMCKQLQDWIQFSCLQEWPVKTTIDREVYAFFKLVAPAPDCV